MIEHGLLFDPGSGNETRTGQDWGRAGVLSEIHQWNSQVCVILLLIDVYHVGRGSFKKAATILG